LAVVRGRDSLVAARTQLINAVRGMVKSVGGRLPKTTTAAFAGKVPGLIPSELKVGVGPLLKSIASAVVAVARKLAVLLHGLWVTAEVYEPMYGIE
jgi:transposase